MVAAVVSFHNPVQKIKNEPEPPSLVSSFHPLHWGAKLRKRPSNPTHPALVSFAAGFLLSEEQAKEKAEEDGRKP
jgi:hypothetical protein